MSHTRTGLVGRALARFAGGAGAAGARGAPLVWSALVLCAAAAVPGAVLVVAPSAEPGQHGVVHGRVVDRRGAPVSGARLHVYQTDATGSYTRERAMDEPHARLAGWVACDDSGRFELRTIRPGGYPKALRLGDRERHIPAHIHLDLELAGRAGHHWQAVFADDTLLTDPYWRDWVRRLGQPVLAARVARGRWDATLVLVAE